LQGVDKRTYVFTPVMVDNKELPEEARKEQRRKDKDALDNWWVLQGRCLIFGALHPSKSGLIHKHIVKYIVVLPLGRHFANVLSGMLLGGRWRFVP
jgi:hypothetical protein